MAGLRLKPEECTVPPKKRRRKPLVNTVLRNISIVPAEIRVPWILGKREVFFRRVVKAHSDGTVTIGVDVDAIRRGIRLGYISATVRGATERTVFVVRGTRVLRRSADTKSGWAMIPERIQNVEETQEED